MSGIERSCDHVAFLEAAVIAQLARDGLAAVTPAEMQRREPAEPPDKADDEGQRARRIADRDIPGPDPDTPRPPGARVPRQRAQADRQNVRGGHRACTSVMIGSAGRDK